MSDKIPKPAPAMPDNFTTFLTQLDSPAEHFFAIEPSDADRLPTRPRAIRVGGAGDVAAVAPDGETVLFKGCYAGEILPIRAVQIKAAGTTATDLVAFV